MEKSTPCRRCGHSLGEHCIGNLDHGYHKNASQYRPSAIIHCTKRHCDEPLCSCIEFIRDGKGFVKYMRETVAIYGQVTLQPYQIGLLSGKFKEETIVKKLAEASGLAAHKVPHLASGGLTVVFRKAS